MKAATAGQTRQDYESETWLTHATNEINMTMSDGVYRQAGTLSLPEAARAYNGIPAPWLGKRKGQGEDQEETSRAMICDTTFAQRQGQGAGQL